MRTASFTIIALLGVACAAGSTVGAARAPDTGPASLLRFSAEASIVVDSLAGWRYMRLAASIQNPGAGPVSFTLHRPCSVLGVLYRTADRRGRPAWREDWDIGGCKSLEWAVTLRGDSALTLSTAVATRDILGDSLPRGVYHVIALVLLEEAPARHVEFPAGAIELQP